MYRSKNWKLVRSISLIFLVILLWCCIDLGMNLAAAMIPSMNDGIGCRSFLYLLLHGDQNWSLEAYWNSLNRCCYLTLLVLIENIVLAILNIWKREK